MADWTVPGELEGDAGLLRVHATAARAGEQACPQYLAAKARPGLWLPQRSPRGPGGLATFPLNPLMELLDIVEFDGLTLEQAQARLGGGRTASRLHAGLLRWIGHAATRFLSASAALDAARGWAAEPASRPWVMQVPPPVDADGPTYELCAWGRGYESADGQMRELRLPRVKSVADRAVDPGEAAAAALVLARGRPALGRPGSGKAHHLGRPHLVTLVRVVEVGCEDGSWQVMFDGPPQKAKLQYDGHARKRLGAVIAGGEYRPGVDCADCKLREACPALPRRPGLLDIAGIGRPVRTWSVTNGRHYMNCPAQEYLERLHLRPAADHEPGSAVRRGQAVHGWLADRHARQPARPCRADDVPSTPDAWSAGGWDVTGEDARLGVQMIGDHSLTCALQNLPPGTVILPEHQLLVYDPDAMVLIIAKADLLYESGGAWVLRETKTTRTVIEGSLLEHFPQAALAILLLAAGIPGGSPERNRVELERLTPAGPLLDMFSPSDRGLHAEARRVVREIVTKWRADDSAIAVPGPGCRTCVASRWCPDAAIDAPQEDDDDD
jgi:PD-(D/E)XK nuclease superfamily